MNDSHAKPQCRYAIIGNLLNSQSKSNSEVYKVWKEESLQRLAAYKKGEMKTFSYGEVFS